MVSIVLLDFTGFFPAEICGIVFDKKATNSKRWNLLNKRKANSLYSIDCKIKWKQNFLKGSKMS